MAAKAGPGKLIGMILGAVLVVGGGIFVFTYSPPPPEAPPPLVRPAKVIVLETAADAADRSYAGKVRPTQEVELSFRVAGPLVEFSVKGAQEVAKGEILGRIDPRDFEVNLRTVEGQLDSARAELKAMVTGARAEDIEKLKAEVARTQAEFDRAEADYQRFKKAGETNAVSKSEVDRMFQMKERAGALLTSARENLKIGQVGARQEDIDAKNAQIRALEASRDSAADQLEYTILKAPFAGKVARTYIENFQHVLAQESILSLQDVSTIEIEADIPESVVAGAKREMVERFVVRFDFLPDREFEAKFSEAETDADPRTQTYRVTFVMPNPEDVRILGGMSAMVSAELKSGAGLGGEAWKVPAGAILSDQQGNSFVWKVDQAKMTVEKVAVVLGDVVGNWVLLTSGVARGDMIVTAGVHHLQPGTKIRRLETSAP